jgi:Cu/Ag efflux protein CusF
MPTAAPISAAEHLKRVPPAVRPTVQAARRTVKGAAPKAKEITYRSSRAPGAKSPSMYKLFRYVVDEEQVAGIGTFSKYAAIFFSRGGEIDDPGGLLQGSGKSRFVRMRTTADAQRPKLKRIIRQAFRMSSS